MATTVAQLIARLQAMPQDMEVVPFWLQGGNNV